ncbi:MAG: DUF5615 family PIN-like protein, partial [Kovacikia sp.]
SDYNDLSLMQGFPPKVIWISRDNCSTQAIEQMLRSATDMLQRQPLLIIQLHLPASPLP